MYPWSVYEHTLECFVNIFASVCGQKEDSFEVPGFNI